MPFIIPEYLITYYFIILFNIITHFNFGFRKYVLLSGFPFKIYEFLSCI